MDVSRTKIRLDTSISATSNSERREYISQDGTYVGASALAVQGMVEPEVLEAMAVREALALTLDLHIQKIQAATDCKSTVNHLQAEYRGKSAMIINDIQEMTSKSEVARVWHEPREANNRESS
jgi:hypothetical protein